MVFTVVYYIPLIEENTSSKTEMTKNAGENETDGEDGDGDPEDQNEDLTEPASAVTFALQEIRKSAFFSLKSRYLVTPGDKSIPPPRA